MPKRTDRTKPRGEGTREYSKFRTRWRHVLLIDQHVRAGRAPNCRELAEELEVSRRTVLRDIDFLRYDLGAPIEYAPRRRGYVYTEPNWVMPSIRITEGELFALMVAEKALEAYSGMPWAAQLRTAFDRMAAALPERVEVAPRDLLTRVDFAGDAPSLVDPAILATIARAMKDNRTLRMTYRPLASEETKEYTVDPYILRRARGAWYLAARDHRSGRIPLFNVTRVRTVESTDQEFDYDLADFDSERYFADTFGTHETSARMRVAIEFSGWAAKLVRERQWHTSQELKDLSGGRLRFEVTVAHLDDIWPWALSWGAEAKVIKPRKLARIVADQAAATAGRYAKHKPKR